MSTKHGHALLAIEKQQGLLQRLNARWEKRIVDRVREIVRSDAGASERLDQLLAFVPEAGVEPPPRPSLFP
jgi:hypothetical protein